MFNRERALLGKDSPVQVIGYSYGINGKFSSLVALAKENGKIVGNIQLTSLQMKKSQFIKGYYSDFGKTKIHDNLTTSDVFAMIEKNGNSGKLTISELSKPPTGYTQFKKVINVSFPDGHEADFPIYLSF